MREIVTNVEVEAGKATHELSVGIGNAQVGGSVVEVDYVEVGRGADIVRLSLGPAMKGKRLVVATTVRDRNKQTNKTSVRYVLEVDGKPHVVTLQHEVEKDGDSVYYEAVFQLV